MKLTLIKSYQKVQTITDANGLPVLNELTQRPLTQLKKMFRYAVTEATASEKAMYKRFRNQDGIDYYREVVLKSGEKVPVYVSSQFHGTTVQVDGYTREDGRLGFTVDSTQTDIYESMAEQHPTQAAALQAIIVQMKLAGNRVELQNDEDSIDDEGNIAFDTTSVKGSVEKGEEEIEEGEEGGE
jgi:hypothetical protein